MPIRNAVVIPAYNEQEHISGTLDALSNQSVSPDAIVVVNNASTDDTEAIVEERQEHESNLHLISESGQGASFALNTGFRYAIDELDAGIIGRTDADTQPNIQWLGSIVDYFQRHPEKKLLTGPSLPLHDASFRRRDEILWPAAQIGYRLGNLATVRSLFPLRMAHGHNMAVRSKAFDSVGGFPKATWDEYYENVELSRRIYERYGFVALGYLFDMRVHTSMRRLRQKGYMGMVRSKGDMTRPPSNY
ncbi:MAG TPA: glycosyltransferase family A protein [Candidatus Saccharimonadales bacterium]|nr:glycosyltransferase family A protein [Candidatus Saccharimonadales bacterium]